MKNLKVLISILFLLLLSGCATVYNPVTGRQEFLMIDTQQEVAMGNQIADEIEYNYKLSKDPEQNARVNMIGRRIAAVSDRQDLKYDFKVIENKDVNALSTPGGHVYVNSGLLKQANDDELASVIAHEVGHIAARHAVKAMQTNMAYSLVAGLVFANVKSSPQIRQGAGVALNLILLGYSREDEFEADKLGVKYAYYAGFDPDGMVSFLEKLQRENKENPSDKGLVYLRSHPLYSDRISRARAEAAYLRYKMPMPKPSQISPPIPHN